MCLADFVFIVEFKRDIWFKDDISDESILKLYLVLP
jgi:hypothetical protein